MTWGVHLSVSYLFVFSYCSWDSQGKNTGMVCHSLLQWTLFGQTFGQRWRSSIHSAKQDWELTVAQIMNSLLPNTDLNWRKVGKTTRPFRYDLNHVPCDYTVETTNRFKGLDLIECLKNYGRRFVTLYWRQWSRPSTSKRIEKGKMAVSGGLTDSSEKKRSLRQGEKEWHTHLNTEFQTIARRDKKAFLSDQCKKRGKQ